MPAALLLLAGWTAPLSAQTTATNEAAAEQRAGGLEEILVTARRREENLQTVPMAVTAFSEGTLRQNDFRTVTDLERSVPGLNICCNRGQVGFAWLRGIPGVVGYFADVPVALNGSALFFDVENIQVLKGPQGTLFGVSTNGGAILYSPTRPTDRFEGYVQGSVGNYSRSVIEGVVNVPLADGKLLVRVGGQRARVDGYLHDLTQNRNLGDENYDLGRAAITFRPAEAVENSLFVNAYKFRSHGNTLVLSEINANAFAALIFGAPALNDLLARQQALGRYAITGSAIPGGTSEWTRQLNLVDTASWQITDDLTLRNIFGYQRVKSFSRTDLDSTPLPIFDLGVSPTGPSGPATQTSDELQLQGKALSGRLTYVAGTFHQWTSNRPTPSFNNVLGGLSGALNQNQSRTRAVYGQGTYDLSAIADGLSATAGIRYSWDRRSVDTSALSATGAPLTRFVGSGSWKSPSYTLNLSYQATKDTMIFVTNSRGYSSGGFNTGNFVPEEFRTYKPENLNNFEVGVKSDWTLGRVQGRLNVSGFYGLYNDIQAYLVRPATAAAPPPGTVLVIQSAAKGHIKGIDGELTVLPAHHLELSGNFTVLRMEYDRYLSAGQDLSNREFPFAPKLKFGLRATWHLPLDAALGNLSLSGNYTRQSKVNGNANKDVPIRQDYLPAFDNVNLSLNWREVLGHDGLDATLFVTNLTEQATASGRAATYDNIGILGYAVAPRTWGVTLRYGF